MTSPSDRDRERAEAFSQQTFPGGYAGQVRHLAEEFAQVRAEERASVVEWLVAVPCRCDHEECERGPAIRFARRIEAGEHEGKP